MFSVIQSGGNDLLRSYITRGFNVNEEGYNGLTPLMYATTYGSAETVRLPRRGCQGRRSDRTAAGYQ